MKKHVLAAIHHLISENHNQPFSIILVSEMLHVDIEEIKSCFKELIQDGIIKKKYKLLNIYIATPQGIQLIIDSAKESDKEGEAVES